MRHYAVPSVIVSWTGQCRDDLVRRELCDRLAEIAKSGEPFLYAPPLTKRFDQQIGGEIFLSTAVLEQESSEQAIEAEKLPETSAGMSLVSSGEDLTLEERPHLVHTLRLGGPSFSSLISVHDASLFGIEFRFPNVHYPRENRVSFVFLLSPNPGLNGLIVQVENKEQCKEFESETIRDADWFLHKSSIHLRYHCEEWMDFLLGWIKRFYIPDLRYWRYDWLPNYEWQFSKTDPNDTGQRDRLFGILKETLQMECRGWPHLRGDTSNVSFWEKLSAIGTWARFPPHLWQQQDQGTTRRGTSSRADG